MLSYLVLTHNLLFLFSIDCILQYGYDTEHSGLVLLPVDHDLNSGSSPIINSEQLDPWFIFKGVTVSLADATLSVYQLGINHVEYALLAASFGYVSILPDTTGYGASASLVPSPLSQKSLATASIPIYSKVKHILETKSDGMTKLSDNAVYMG